MQKRKFLVVVCVLAVAVAVFAAWNDPWFKGNPKKGRLLVYGDGGALEDSGVEVSAITGLVDSVSSVTGLVATAESKTNKNTANGYAGLDENGKLMSNAIPYIVVVFTGGEYQQ